MKIHRLTLRNYRGVQEATVEFAEIGVTVIEGDKAGLIYRVIYEG